MEGSMIILGIDPGPKESGWVKWDTEKKIPVAMGTDANADVVYIVFRHLVWENAGPVAIEWITGYGQVAGNDTYDTCRWVGRFEQVATRGEVILIPRKEIKLALCGNTTTTDKYIRQALIDRIGEVGTKKKPGPLFGVSGHGWAALAVCLVAAEKRGRDGHRPLLG
jgi:hypothetical protein